MKIVKEQWDQYYPDVSWQKLQDNATRLKKEPEVMNLLLVKGETRRSKRRPGIWKIYKGRTMKQRTTSLTTILTIIV